VDPRDSPLAEARHRLLKRGVLVVQEQAEHVQVTAATVRTQLHARDHLDAEDLARGHRLLDAGRRVMVG
jgi:hypothetical protein